VDGLQTSDLVDIPGEEVDDVIEGAGVAGAGNARCREEISRVGVPRSNSKRESR
jgi:hypothetical protein